MALEKLERLYRQDKIKVLLYKTDSEKAEVDNDQTKEVECLCYLFDNYKDELLDLPFEEEYDPIGNPRHVINPKDIPLTEENMKRVRKEVEEAVVKDWDKQNAKDELLKAKTSV